MKYIKDRIRFIKESKGIIKDDALDILSSHDQNQNTELQKTLDALNDANVGDRVVVRAAPSPTGFLHIGNLRTMLYNYLFAKKNNGIFYLRIEDTDSKRFVSESEQYLKDALEWVGIEPDWSPWKGGPCGPYRQSERDYSKHISTLIENGSAYYAFDTESDMNEIRKIDKYFAYNAKSRMSMKNSLSLPKDEVDKLMGGDYVIRFKMPENETVTFKDIVRGEISVKTDQLDDKVLVKSNGIGTYHMCNVCDDHDMGTTHVIRGEEWISSTPLHILLYKAFGWEPPQFAHLPLLLNPDGKGKLSKRHSLKLGFPVFPMGGEGEDENGNIVKYKGFKDEGYEPDALINFLVLLGWSPGNDIEQMTMAEMISKFDLKKVQKGGARFDIKKAEHFNSLYIKGRSNEELLKYIDKGNTFTYDENKLNQIVDICKSRSTFVKDLNDTAKIFFYPFELSPEDKTKVSEDFKIVMSEFNSRCQEIEWQPEVIKQLIYDICNEKSIKMGKIMPSMRLVLVAGITGPDLMTTAYILGKDETIKRINNSL